MLISPSDIIRESLNMPEVARTYGFTPNRAGFISCPFHGSDKTPSLKLYPSRWNCFGCGEGGDAIDFVRQLLSLSFPEAIERISHDFGLGISNTKPDSAALERIRAERAEKERAKEEAVRRTLALCARRREAWRALRDCPPRQMPDGDVLWPEEWVRAAMSIDYIDYLIDETG